ncbi:MAG TPA: hypothetical protein VFE51_27150 [Verrucomicrobiae bacterium]|nr:hypothetical protein [Verrucomicrobiae bacterium]
MVYADDPAGEGRTEPIGPASILIAREDFWADTCRDTPQMQHPSHDVVELYRRYGCRFCTPGRQQIQYVLTALDSAVAGWEKQHPELFYQTLELNYPELVKRG